MPDIAPRSSDAPATGPVPAPDGALDQALARVFGRSWRTSALGLVSMACGIILVIPGVPPAVADVCRVILPLATGGGLVLAKDHRISGRPAN